MKPIVFLLFCTILASVVPSIFSHEGHAHEPEVHGEIDDGIWKGSQNISIRKMTGVDLRWISSDRNWVTMEMKAKTTGYVSVGFCPNWHGSMEGCDIVVGWVADNGTGFIRDYYATSNASPAEDDSQDYTLIHAVQDEYETRIQFRRKWETDDPQDANLKKSEVRVIYAWHPIDPMDFLHVPPHDRSTRGHILSSLPFHKELKSSGVGRNTSYKIFFLVVIYEFLKGL